jgi:choline kinase
MKAIILAAGVGKRLRSVIDSPKCLIEINGKTLIQRYLEVLQGVNIKEIVIVVGYKKEKVKDAVDKISFSGRVNFIENPEYKRGSILSLWKARGELNENVVLMDGDVYFEQEVFGRLVNSKFKNCLIIDTTSKNEGEEVMVGIKNNRIEAIGRGLNDNFDVIGEWVGFMKISKNATAHLKQILKAGIELQEYEKGYEDVLPELFKQVDFNFELVDGLNWVEIDFPEDVKKATIQNSRITYPSVREYE